MAAKLGIWKDQSSAHSMEFTTDPIIESKFTNREERQSPDKNENLSDSKDQQPPLEYRKLGEIIKKYKKVSPFGSY